VYIGIGSNLGDRRANTLEAIDRVKGLPTTKVVRSSSLYESEPLGDAKTWFVNSVIELETEIAPDPAAEEAEGDRRSDGAPAREGKRRGSRIIDLDIFSCSSIRTSIEKRAQGTPSRDAQARFVLLPLAELAPHVIHPQLGQSIRPSLLATLQGPETGDAPAARLSAAGAQRPCARARPSRRAPRTRRARAARRRAAGGGTRRGPAPPRRTRSTA
jgi:2-amino-4-hydroxy-6-hydroxymethyldihydropteridine diphosphokinase